MLEGMTTPFCGESVMPMRKQDLTHHTYHIRKDLKKNPVMISPALSISMNLMQMQRVKKSMADPDRNAEGINLKKYAVIE